MAKMEYLTCEAKNADTNADFKETSYVKWWYKIYTCEESILKLQ